MLLSLNGYLAHNGTVVRSDMVITLADPNINSDPEARYLMTKLAVARSRTLLVRGYKSCYVAYWLRESRS